ncbi:MAG: P1 family peptidase, partial [Anaerolineales bacterium]
IPPTPQFSGFFPKCRVVKKVLSGGIQFGAGENTVIGVVATNARLNKEQVNKVAQMAHDGLARAIRPAHTMFDGDTIFALAAGEIPADTNVVGSFSAEVFAQAILQAVYAAKPIAGLPTAPVIMDYAINIASPNE